MAQQFFSSATSPNTSQLDANFTELYAKLAELFNNSGSYAIGTAGYAGNQAARFYVRRDSTTGAVVEVQNEAANGKMISFTTNGETLVGSISFTPAGVAYNVTSDARLKTGISDAGDAGALLDSVQVRQYDWKSTGFHQRFGFVAQELVQVVPEAVHQPSDSAEMMAVDYSKLVPLLVSEVQALRRRVAALES